MQRRTKPVPERAPAAADRSLRLVYWAFPIIALVTGVAYANTFFVPFYFDDRQAIIDNSSILHLWPPWVALWPPAEHVAGVIGRPLVNFSLAINYAMTGYASWSYHATNLLIHVLAACVLLGVVRRTLLRPGLREKFGDAATPLSFLIALLWAVHPLQTETVTNVVQRNESMVSLFYLLVLYALIRSVNSSKAQWWRAGAIAACFLGVASKEVMVTAPIVALLYDRTFLAGSFRGAWRERRNFYGGLFCSWILLTVLMFADGQRGGTVGFGLGMSWWSYALKQCSAVPHYLQLAFWPHPLVIDYGMDVATSFSAVAVPAAILAILLAATIWALWRRPAAGFLGACFFLILAPSSSVVPLTTQTMAEHRMYLPLAAVITLVVLGVYTRIGRRSYLGWAALALPLAAGTYARNLDYKSELRMWEVTARQRPGNERAHYNLGCALMSADRNDEAVGALQQALKIKPDYVDALCNLGTTYSRLGENDQAVAQYRSALQIDPDDSLTQFDLGCVLLNQDKLAPAMSRFLAAVQLDPGYGDAEANLGSVLIKLGEPGKALPYLESAVSSSSNDATVLANYGFALLSLGRAKEAIPQLEKAVELEANSLSAHKNLSMALAQDDQLDRAVTEDRAALRIDPQDAEVHFNFGNHLYRLDQNDEALTEFKEALRIRPGYAEAENHLGNVLLREGHTADAQAAYLQAVQLKPDYAEARLNLGNAYFATGQLKDAETQFAAAVKTDPNYAEAHNNLGSVLTKEGNYTEAEVQYEEALRLRPDYSDAQRNLRALQAALGMPAK